MLLRSDLDVQQTCLRFLYLSRTWEALEQIHSTIWYRCGHTLSCSEAWTFVQPDRLYSLKPGCWTLRFDLSSFKVWVNPSTVWNDFLAIPNVAIKYELLSKKLAPCSIKWCCWTFRLNFSSVVTCKQIYSSLYYDFWSYLKLQLRLSFRPITWPQ